MKKSRLFGILLIVISLVIMSLPFTEAGAETSASDFVIKDGVLTKYTGTASVVSIPDEVETIGEGSFENNLTVEAVAFGKNVTSIEAYAFWGCNNLKSISINAKLQQIDDFAFAGCKGLQKVTIPKNIKSIGIQAFGDCIGLTEIYIPKETTTIHDSAFDGCNNLEILCEKGSEADIFAQKFEIKKQVKDEYENTGSYPENNTSGTTAADSNPANSTDTVSTPTTSVDTTPGKVLGTTWVVGNSAFVFLDPGNSTVIGTDEQETSSEEEEVPETDYRVSLASILTGDRIIPKLTVIDKSVVADSAYYKKNNIETIRLPETLQEIGQFAFARSNLRVVEIPEGTTTIGYGAFYHCDDLESIVLPSSIVCIEPKAFDFTKVMSDFQNSEDDFLILGNSLISYKGNNETVTIPEQVTVIAANAFSGNESIRQVVLDDNLKVIGEEAFADCKNLNKVIMNQNLMQVMDRAFQNTAMKTMVTLPDSIEKIGIDCFPAGYQSSANKPIVEIAYSTTRLSNSSLRGQAQKDEQKTVVVSGLTGAKAQLDYSDRTYYLSISEAENASIKKAWERVITEAYPENSVCYALDLKDSSGISIEKLGKNNLTLYIPVKDCFKNSTVCAVGTDRNGQLELLECKKGKLDNAEYFSVTISQATAIALFEVEDGLETLEEVITFESFAKPKTVEKQTVFGLAKYRIPFGIVLLFIGSVMVIYSFWSKKNA